MSDDGDVITDRGAEQDVVATERDPLVDALRAFALLVVVLGHFMMADTRWAGDELVVSNALKINGAGWTHWLTWVFQPMPLLFAVGAFANAVSWHRSGGDADVGEQWLLLRVRRLCVPATTFVVALMVAAVLVEPIAPSIGHELSRRLSVPL